MPVWFADVNIAENHLYFASSGAMLAFVTFFSRSIFAGTCLVLLSSTSGMLWAQWPKFLAAGLPRTADGKPDLSAPAPKAADGKPDLSGVWEISEEQNAFG